MRRKLPYPVGLWGIPEVSCFLRHALGRLLGFGLDHGDSFAYCISSYFWYFPDGMWEDGIVGY